ncbi:MAG: sulfatase-like hydrolase/transferase [Thermoanaerobaculia bacterium]
MTDSEKLDLRALRIGWIFATLPLAWLSLFLYFFFEWLFQVTKPSPLASVSIGQQLHVLVVASLPLLFPLFLVQLAATILSVVAFPRLRWLATFPAAIPAGLLAFMLVDNFTHSIIGVGMLSGGPITRKLYVLLLFLFTLLAARLIFSAVSNASRGSIQALVALGIAALLSSPLVLMGARAEQDWRQRREASAPVLQRGTATARSELPNILLLGSDGVTATATSVYGPAKGTTPYLESLRNETLLCENAFSNVGRTHGSLVTLLTGRVPLSTKVVFPPQMLEGEAAYRHLPGILKSLGYSTIQIGMRHYADAEDANLRGGFDEANYRWQRLLDSDRTASADARVTWFRRTTLERLEDRILHITEIRHMPDEFAEIIHEKDSPYLSDARRVATLLEFFEKTPEPWFAHVHLLDTHCCGKESPAEVALRMDDHFKNVIESLRKRGKIDRTLVVFSSDHTRGWSIKGRIPLIFRFPHGRFAGRVEQNVQLADVAPTIVDYLGLEAPPWMDGASILNSEELPADRPIVAITSSDEGISPISEFLAVLKDDGPPNYGSTNAALIVGSQWYELDLKSGAGQSGTVSGHTQPERSGISDEALRALLVARLWNAGFRIPGVSAGSDKASAVPTAAGARQ